MTRSNLDIFHAISSIQYRVLVFEIDLWMTSGNISSNILQII